MMNEELQGIMLEDSWILSWVSHNGSLIFEVEFSLWPGHQQYQQPKEGEWACYRKGKLIFEGITSVLGLRQVEDVSPIIGPDGEQDYGSIDTLEELRPGEFAIVGDFGEVDVKCRSLKIEIAA